MSGRRVRLDPLAAEALERLERDQLREGYRASAAELVSGIVFGTSAPQAVGMTRAFVMARARRKQAEREAA